jgi:aspartate carbamoyltransferase catalytic subunit
MSSVLSSKHLISIKDLSTQDIELILETSKSFKEILNKPVKKVPTLRDFTIANIFFENSTRTKLSFELAQKRLSADVINFAASSSSVSKGETLIDTVNNILAMKVDMVVMRHSAAGAAYFLSNNVNSIIINAGDGAHQHPTQALLDTFTLKDKIGSIENKKIVIVGDILHSRVAMSNILCLNKLGAQVAVCGPNSLLPKYLNTFNVKVFTNLAESLNWCDAAIMLRIQNERLNISYFPSLRDYTQRFSLTQEVYNKLKKPIFILHPGPINRGVEIESTVADGNNSLILEQVENGVATRMAVTYLLANNR